MFARGLVRMSAGARTRQTRVLCTLKLELRVDVGSLQEQYSLLIAEPSLQACSWSSIFFLNVHHSEKPQSGKHLKFPHTIIQAPQGTVHDFQLTASQQFHLGDIHLSAPSCCLQAPQQPLACYRLTTETISQY